MSVDKVSTGYLDAVQMLYSNDSMLYSPAYPGNTFESTNYLDINIGNLNYEDKFTDTIKILLSGSMEQVLSKKPGEVVRLKSSVDDIDMTYYA